MVETSSTHVRTASGREGGGKGTRHGAAWRERHNFMTTRCIVFPVWDLPFLLFLFFRTRRLISFSGLFGVAGSVCTIKFSFVFEALLKCFRICDSHFALQYTIANIASLLALCYK